MFSWCQSHVKYMYFGIPKQQCRGYPGLQGNIKTTYFYTQIPRWPDITITYYLLYKNYVFMVPKPLKISTLWYPKTAGKQQSCNAALRITNKAAKQPAGGGGVGRKGRRLPAKLVPSQQLSCNIKKASRARSILSIFLASPCLRGITKFTHFCTQILRWPDITITSYLLYKSYVFMVRKPPKILIFWYPKAAIKLQSQ